MINYQQGLRDLINTTLNANDNGIIFNTEIYNSKEINYYKDYQDESGYGVTRKRLVPSMITQIIGNYINIPNISVTDNSISLEFDLCIDDYTSLRYEKQDEYKSVDYSNTLLAIDNLRQELLAKYHPLGDKLLRFGGIDSKASVDIDTSFDVKTIYIDFIPKNNLEEDILGMLDGIATRYDIIYKDEDYITFKTDTSLTAQIPYTVGERIKLIFYYDDSSNTWTGKNVDTGALYGTGGSSSAFDINKLIFGGETGFSGILYELYIDNEKHEEISDEDSYNIILADFDSKETFTNQGESTFGSTNEINNCILWGSYGNAIFSFETLVPFGDILNKDDGTRWQLFGLTINALVSNDILFGNNFEYHLTVPYTNKSGLTEYVEEQIYPVDRQLTYASNYETYQRINDKYGTGIVVENAKDLTKSFFYDGSYHIESLLRQIAKNDQEQNQEYTLRVQYPFFTQTYTVNVENGGTSPNLNELTTLTVTFKEKFTNEE